MIQPSASTPAAPACVRTPELARAVLRIILAPLIALVEVRITAALNQLLGLMQQWRDGTLPPPPPERQYGPRQITTRPYFAPRAQAPSWLNALCALAVSDHPASRFRPRQHGVSLSSVPRSPDLSIAA